MLNKIILKGNLGRAPHIAIDKKGREIATFSLATSTTWKDASGEWQQHVDWHRVVVFRDSTIRWIKDVLKKGDTVYIEGKLTYHPWIDKYNQPRITPTIVVTGFEGKVEHLRSSKLGSCSSIQKSQEDPFEERTSGESLQFFESSNQKPQNPYIFETPNSKDKKSKINKTQKET